MHFPMPAVSHGSLFFYCHLESSRKSRAIEKIFGLPTVQKLLIDIRIIHRDDTPWKHLKTRSPQYIEPALKVEKQEDNEFLKVNVDVIFYCQWMKLSNICAFPIDTGRPCREMSEVLSEKHEGLAA